jgi:TPR repeat protein
MTIQPKARPIIILAVSWLALCAAPCFAEDVSFTETLAKAERGDAAAQYSLGRMYEYGDGVEKDDGRALSWLRKAAQQGYEPAPDNLKVMYEQGIGIGPPSSR